MARTTHERQQQTHNEVHLVGRVSGTAQERTLPSGDVVVQLRVVVSREEPRPRPAGGPRRPSVDTIDVACWRGPLRRKALRLDDGMPVEVRGALRRRFWRSGPAVVSRYEVEATHLVRARPA